MIFVRVMAFKDFYFSKFCPDYSYTTYAIKLNFTGLIGSSYTCAYYTGFLLNWFWLSYGPWIKETRFGLLMIFVPPAT
jgi:hypothetical protein